MGDVYTNPPQSRNEAILNSIVESTQYTDPPQSRIEDLLLQVKEVIEEGGHDESATRASIAPTESDSAHASKNIAVGEQFYLSDDKLYTATSAISQGSAIVVYPTAEYNCKLSDSVTGQIAQKVGWENTTSVVTQSSDLVESGAVYDALVKTVGYVNNNLFDGTLKNGQIGAGGSYSSATNRITNVSQTQENTFFLKKGTYTISADNLDNVTAITKGDDYSIIDNFANSWNNLPFTFTTTQDGYLYFTLKKSDNSNINPSDYWAKVEEGSTATPYHASIEDTLRDAEVIDGKNKINYPYSSPSGLYNGITVTINDDDGTINVSGTAQDRAVIYIANGSAMYDLPNGDYIVTAEGMPINCGLIVDAYNNASWSKQLAQVLASYPSVNITVDHDGYNHINSYIYINDGATVNATIKPMIRKASETDATYEPYYVPLKDVVPTKADNSVIGTVEGANASKAWSVGEHFIKDGQFKEVTQPIASGGAISDSNTVDRPIADCLVYKAGDSITGQFTCAGYLTSSAKEIFAVITLSREIIANGFNCTVNTITSRGIGGYLIPNASAFTNYKIKVKYIDGVKNQVVLVIANSDDSAFSGTNNTPATSVIDLTITFT